MVRAGGQLLAVVFMALEVLVVFGCIISVAQGEVTRVPVTRMAPVTGEAGAQPFRPVVREIFVVSERDPFTGELVGTPRQFFSRLEAHEYRDVLRAAAWVVWRSGGAKEAARWTRFPTRAAAEKFVASAGPALRGLLGGVPRVDQCRITPARVQLEVIYAR